MTTREQRAWRKAKIMDMLSNGETNQSEIARILQINRSLVCRDIEELKAESKKNIQDYGEKLCFEFDKCLTALNNVHKKASSIANNDHVDERVQLQALALCRECITSRLDLVTNVRVVDETINYVNELKTKTDRLNDDNDNEQEELEIQEQEQ